MKFKQKPEINASNIPCDKEFLEKKFLLQADMPASSKDDDNLDKNTSWRHIPVSKETVVFSLRLPKKDMQQLKYISKYLGISVNGICLSVIQANNKKILKEIEENL